MVIVLTYEEKKTLFRFLTLYLGSLFILFALIAYLFYQVEYRLYHNNAKHQMQMKASSLSSQIIHAHMNNSTLSLKTLSDSSKLDIGFYDDNGKPITTKIEKQIDFSGEFYENDKHLMLVDRSAFGHLGVTYIVIQEGSFFEKIAHIKTLIISILASLYLLVTAIGYYLAKLFIKPIQMKRIQLNNFIKESTHELNTPISALLMSIKPAKQMSVNDFERIEISARRVSDIYKDLTYLFLTNSQPSARAVKKMVVNRVIEKQVSHQKPLSLKKRVVITQSYHDEIVCTIDEESLIRLINNLLSNAIKYNKPGGTIEITTKDQTLTIRDSGIGIPKKHHKEIYKRFYRATDESGGFGLGLNIVYKICKNYSITIRVESEVGKGTEFTLVFPSI